VADPAIPIAAGAAPFTKAAMPEDETKSRPETLRELTQFVTYLRPYRRRFVLAMAASLVSMSFGGLFPFLVGKLLDASIPSVKVIPVSPWLPSLNVIALVLMGTLFIQAVLTFFSSLNFNIVGERAVVDLRRELYSHLIAQPMRFFGEHRVGELSSRLSNDLSMIQDTMTFTVAQIIRQTMMCLTGFIAIAVTSLRLSLVMLASVPVVMLVGVLFGRRVRGLSKTAQDRLAETATVVEETFQGIANVKAFGNEPYESERYAQGLRGYLTTVLRNARYRAGLIAFVILGIFGAIVLVLWYGARLMQEGVISHGELTRFMFYTIFIGGAASSIPEIVSNVQKTLGATHRVRELLREPPEALQASGPPPPRLAGDVRFADVRFSYPSRPDLPVLRGLSLSAAPGEKIALVGPSGAGKSTIVSLLLRFYDPDSGQLFLDGQNARDLPLETVRGNMAIVPQEVLLFGGSIRDNIAYGKPGATHEEILAASQRANCHEFIQRFPEGYATLVGERGVKVSGGQRQRIAIARALLKDPAILILDEATSSLDSESEALIQQALATLLAGRTAFIIAHRLSTVRQCDRICVIENGAVTESGTHAELMASQGGTYRRLSELQFTVQGDK
jgi:ABC-type multidrug transport system fused ATPase/permease subunit